MLVLAEQNRVFGYAVAASLALHALLLPFAMPAMREDVAPRPEPPLVAHLAEPAPPPPVVKEPQERPKPAPRKPLPRPKLQPAPIETVEEGVSQAELAPPPAPPPPIASTAPAAPAAPAALVVPAAAPATPDPGAALARFRQEVVDIARRNKRYPLMARDNGWTGDVVVRIEVAASGKVISVKVRTSSGFDVLDEQALETFRNAALQAAVPPALRGKGFSVEALMQYKLD